VGFLFDREERIAREGCGNTSFLSSSSLGVLPQAFQAFDIDINRYDRYPLGQIKSDWRKL